METAMSYDWIITNYPFKSQTIDSPVSDSGGELVLPGELMARSSTHHPEPEEAERSWALECGDSHGRLPFWASGRCDVDLRQNHSTKTQPGPGILKL